MLLYLFQIFRFHILIIHVGIYDVYIDFPLQKLTVVGWADPEKILKAIKKTRKNATICFPKEAENAAPEENPPPTESPATDPEPAPLAEPPKEPPPPPPQPSGNQPKEEANPPPAAAGDPTPAPAQPPSPFKVKEVEEIHVVHHHPHHLGYDNQWNLHLVGHGFRPHETPYHVVTHGYNTYRTSPSVCEYHRPPPPTYARFSSVDHYVDEYQYQYGREGEGNQITSIFSDENPNACRIV